MVTLISEVTSSGKRRSCNARCYQAKKPKCVCLCNSKNHGVGYEKAIENCQEIAKGLLEHESRQIIVFLPAEVLVKEER